MVEIGKGRLDVHVSAPPRWLAHRDGVFLAACDRALKPPVEALVHLSELLARPFADLLVAVLRCVIVEEIASTACGQMTAPVAGFGNQRERAGLVTVSVVRK
jgi:hypothetical protein